MKVSIANVLPSSDSGRVLAAFLVEGSAVIPAKLRTYGFEVGDMEQIASEKGKKSLISLSGALLWTMGMGTSPSREHMRRAANQLVDFANEYGHEEIWLFCPTEQLPDLTAITESLILSNYQFLTYKSRKKTHRLQAVHLLTELPEAALAVERGTAIATATSHARDLVNEPVITLTATELAHRVEGLGEQYGFRVEVFNEARIRSLKMGGILAVNSGSQEPPTFSILEYRPENPVNKQPIVLVGKGVVFDTGGLSLKPTANSMDFMKADMAGAAAVIGALCGLAMLKSRCHVIGLIPATDNRPGENAYVPSDVITLYDGTTVEVLNTDAEGRIILADALAYARQYKPELVIDLATLTGAKVIAVGTAGLAMMSTAPQETQQAIMEAGENVYERLAVLPLWDEYREALNSDIADLKNVGGREAGSIVAGKFLEHFTGYPWIHLDIAGSAWQTKNDSYRGKNGTGVGVRLLLEFLSNYHTLAHS